MSGKNLQELTLYIDERHHINARAIKVTASFWHHICCEPTASKGKRIAQPYHFCEHHSHCCYCCPSKCTHKKILLRNLWIIQFTHSTNSSSSSLTCSFPLEAMFHNRKPVISSISSVWCVSLMTVIMTFCGSYSSTSSLTELSSLLSAH